MEQAGSRDPSFDFPVRGTTGSSSLRLQPCALKPPVRILVIDDERSFVRGLARLLRRDGYIVDTAENGTAGLAQLRAQRYDVVLCDLRMPALDGPTLYTIVQQQFPALCQRLIFVTGDTLGVESSAFLARCGQPCLYKPCTAADVRRAIEQRLGCAASTGTDAPDEGEGSDDGGPLREEGRRQPFVRNGPMGFLTNRVG